MLKSFWSQKKLHTGLPWNILIIPSLLLTSAEAEEGRQFEKNYTLKYWDVSVRHLVFETRNMLESKNNNKCFYGNIFFLQICFARSLFEQICWILTTMTFGGIDYLHSSQDLQSSIFIADHEVF